MRNERGQTTTEYSVVLTLITIGCIMAVSGLATSVINAIARVAALIP
jgi:Flp pilus assembly pilin Flp